jgi:hypothetical protein
VFLAQHRLEPLVGIFSLELLDSLLQCLDPLLLPLADVPLGLAVVGALALELLGGELCDGARSRAARSPATFGRLLGGMLGVVEVVVPGHG